MNFLFLATRSITAAFVVFSAFTSPAASATTVARPPVGPTATAAVFDHSSFDRLLKQYVNDKGLVNYKALKAKPQQLNQYLQLLSKNPPAPSWSKQEQMAYWINAYNAYTIRLILNHYPLESIKDIGSKIKIPLVTTPWAMKFFTIGGQKMSLDEIEHGILRKKYNDPRIHFALVCASISCPRLRTEAYTAAQLDRQLDDQGRDFLNNPGKNKVGKSEAQLSKYFDWYKSDWTENGQSVASWVNKYSTIKMSSDAKVSYLDYNWQLNEQ
ncbi:DUF547 domain-containing protein [Hymenobacter taeanensis]|uniref:DUF547 domain-containing protein n=1 Tax=Hymenobacter taeanensis TaxID=2735321 RepID=A0A6M6BL63_9BACT|nr:MULTISPECIES: DUF547 domain-containing protein [Hymenobacter]QJX48193.1 DUF547 domain-containing protein [Hymenobacter taeanensis]UOQ82332.1 DUF547 domain-containing protein [Hymenobacter sp. 5414T-23]